MNAIHRVKGTALRAKGVLFRLQVDKIGENTSIAEVCAPGLEDKECLKPVVSSD